MSVERISYSVSEAASAVGKSRYVLYDAIRRKELVAYQQSPESDYSILTTDLIAWLTRLGAQPKPTMRRRGMRRARFDMPAKMRP
jgi:hypothetical protein